MSSVHAKPVKVFTETWKPVPGYGGRYLVSSAGRVYSLGNVRRRSRMLRASADTNGYRMVTLYSGEPGRNAGWKVKVAVIVLLAFRGESNGLDSCHGDGNPTNDRLDNLSWGTRTRNVEDARRHGTLALGERNGHAKLTDTDARILRARLLRGESGSVLAREHDMSPGSMSMLKNGQRWTHLL